MDEIGVKILKTLLVEPRTTLTELAKECKISVQAIRSRYECMKKSGIINGAIMQINPKSLGLNCCGVVKIFTDGKQGTEIDEYFAAQPWPAVTFPSSNNKYLIKTVGVPNVDVMGKTVGELSAFSHVKFVESDIWIDELNMVHPENLIIPPDEKYDLKAFKEKSAKQDSKSATRTLSNQSSKDMHIDEVDRKIAKLLAENARLSFSRIAKQVGITTKTVIMRYNRMKKNNILHFSSVSVNLEKLGYNAMAVIMIKLAKGASTLEVFDQIIKMPNFIITQRTLGSHDLCTTIPLKNFEQLFEVQKVLLDIDSVENIITEIHRPFQRWPISKYSSIL
jgi:Lrp/AsnC family transcriptional regulator, regulator for asnA, asnC and gidA